MDKRIIFHIDVNSAFLSWEAVYRLKFLGGKVDLREIPSAIGGDMSKRHGIILAKSIPAKAFAIKTAEPVIGAKQKCPNLVIAPPNYNLYERCSKAFIDILRKYTPIVEQYSIDEAFMDMSHMNYLYADPIEIAHKIRKEIEEELGFTVNVGVSNNKLLAKMASDFQKPNRVHTLFDYEIKDKMWKLPVNDLFFVGRATVKKLSNLGIYTIGELANTDVEILKCHMKKHGEIIYNFANGIDFSIVEPEPVPNKGYGNSTTISFDVRDATTAKIVLLGLTETVAQRLRKDGVRAGGISVGIKDYELHYTSHQRVLEVPTNITGELHRYVCELFDELWDGKPIRHLGVHTSKVNREESGRQMSLFDHTDYAKLEKLDEAIDSIRHRYGMDAVKRAVFANIEEIDHMSGGISREKRSVDYSKLDID